MELKKICRTGLGALFVYAVLLQWNGRAAEKDGGFVAYPSVSGATGPVLFSHRTHGLRGAGYACDKCHASSNKALNVTMDDIRNGQACGSCHNGRIKGPRSQTAAASIQDCAASSNTLGVEYSRNSKQAPVLPCFRTAAPAARLEAGARA